MKYQVYTISTSPCRRRNGPCRRRGTHSTQVLQRSCRRQKSPCRRQKVPVDVLVLHLHRSTSPCGRQKSPFRRQKVPVDVVPEYVESYVTQPLCLRATARSIFSSTVVQPPTEPPLTTLRNRFGHRLDPFRFIVAYHRRPNLRNLLCARKFRNDSFRILPSVPALAPPAAPAITRPSPPDLHVEPTYESLARAYHPLIADFLVPRRRRPRVTPTDEAKAKQIG